MTSGGFAFDLNDAGPQVADLAHGRLNAANDQADRDRRLAGLRETLRRSADVVFRELFPHGETTAKEGRIGNVQGDHGESLKVDFLGKGAGLWRDHATGEGGDLIALYRKFHGCTLPEAVEGLEGVVGISHAEPARDWVRRTKERATRQVQAAGPKPYTQRGAHWDYWSADGSRVLARVVRFEKHNPLTHERIGKTFRLAILDAHGREVWEGPAVRPLYNLPAITAADTVVFCEGEKCADALAALGVPSTAMIGGANGDLDKVDWAPLRGKRLILWGDNDEPGREFVRRVQSHLVGMPCAPVVVPAGKPEKWDAADCVAEPGGKDEAKALLGAAWAVLDAMPAPANVEPEVIEFPAYSGVLPPPRAWVYGDFLMAKASTLIAAPPGVGKTTFSFQLAIAVAFGLDFGPWGPVPGGGGTVLLINGEEPQDELDRRFLGACIEMGVRPEQAGQRVRYMSGIDGSGEGRFKLVAVDPATGLPICTPAVETLKRSIRAGGFSVLIADPLVEFKAGDEGNETLHELGSAFRSIAVDCECAALVFHHTLKSATGDNMAGDMSALRGGMLAGVGRFVLTMFNMTKAEAARLGVAEERRVSLLRIDNAKASMAAMGAGAKWFQRFGVCLDNGTYLRPSDVVGVIRPVRLEGPPPEEGETGALPAPGSVELERIANAVASLCVVEAWTGPDFAAAISKVVEGLDLALLKVGKHKASNALKMAPEVLETDNGRLVFSVLNRGAQTLRRVHFEARA